jgi:hypothetical protein
LKEKYMQQPPTGYGQSPQWNGQPQQGFGQQPYPPQQNQWNQPNQMAQQVYTPYPPPQYQATPPQKPPVKRSSRAWIWIIVALFIGMVIGYAIHTPAGTSTTNSATDTNQTTTQATSQPTQPSNSSTPLPTKAPVQTPKWTTVQTITGNGSKKTAVFTAPNDWKILYSCTYQNIGGVTGDGVLTVSVYGSDGSIIDPAAINATCKNGVAKTTGETEEHQGGQVYLDVNGTGDWTLIVQELK